MLVAFDLFVLFKSLVEQLAPTDNTAQNGRTAKMQHPSMVGLPEDAMQLMDTVLSGRGALQWSALLV